MPDSLAKIRDKNAKFYELNPDIYTYDGCYTAGWDQCYAELLPVIEEMRAAIMSKNLIKMSEAIVAADKILVAK